MTDVVQFSANNVLDWYIEAENMFADFLKYVPYCKEHEAVGLYRGLITANKGCPYWKGNCNKRFKAWYYGYCQSLRDNQ